MKSYTIIIIITTILEYFIAKEITCPKKRPTICTQEYLPVCGLFDSSHIMCFRAPCGMTYGNKCTACADKNVISYTYGSCDNYSQNGIVQTDVILTKNAQNTNIPAKKDYNYDTTQTNNSLQRYFCQGSRTFCTLNYNPVCGYKSFTKGESMRETYSNECYACSNPLVNYYTLGSCETKGILNLVTNASNFRKIMNLSTKTKNIARSTVNKK